MRFDVLQADLDCNAHLLIEASAGTGKTFTIQHLFIRRLLEPLPDGNFLELPHIGVITFTRAATSELRERIRKALYDAIACLEARTRDCCPGYLLPFVQGQETAYQLALRRLRMAQERWEEAAISTIHGFCWRALQGALPVLPGVSSSDWMDGGALSLLIEDFLAHKLQERHLTSSQIYVVARRYAHDSGDLISALARELWDDKDAPIEWADEIVADLQSACRGLGWHSEEVYADLERLADLFCACRNKNGELHAGLRERFCRFSQLFSSTCDRETIERYIRCPLFPQEVFCTPKQRSASLVAGDIPLQALFSLEPILRKIADPDVLWNRLRAHCLRFVQSVMEQKKQVSPDFLLYKVETLLNEPVFQASLRKQFRTLIIDEFQDTDPLQWKILSSLFLSQNQGESFVWLVGDPKQAIYAFRKADVYTYMEAKKQLGDKAHVQLSTNYRSNADLVRALNRLFVGPQSQHLFSLPATSASLDIPPIESAVASTGQSGSAHIFIARGAMGRKRNWPTDELEQNSLFPQIAGEVERLRALGGALSDMAILVKDRHQAARLGAYLDTRGIGTHGVRRKHIFDASAYQLLMRLIRAVQMPRDMPALASLVAHEPMLYSETALRELVTDRALWAHLAGTLVALRKAFDRYGIAHLAGQFLDGAFGHTAGVVRDAMSALPEGCTFLRDFEQAVDLLIEEERKGKRTLEALYAHMRASDCGERWEDPRLLCREAARTDGVHVLTTHRSKGLEFEVVWALGVCSRTLAEGTDQQKREADAEKLRQFYVACTRAKSRLYLFLPIATDKGAPSLGAASAMELCLAAHAFAASSHGDEPCDLYAFMQPESVEEAARRLSEDACITISEEQYALHSSAS